MKAREGANKEDETRGEGHGSPGACREMKKVQGLALEGGVFAPARSRKWRRRALSRYTHEQEENHQEGPGVSGCWKAR